MDRISIVAKFKRVALSVEEQSDRLDFHNKYIPTRQAESFVEDVAFAVQHGGGAHALSGAYGAGKSSLAIFAMNQLCCKTKSFSPTPFKLRNKKSERNCAAVRDKGGLLGISVVGSSVPLSRRIVDGAKKALADYVGTPPESLRKIAAIKSESPDNNKLLSLLGSLADDLRKRKKAGVLLIIDEFGRHLERIVALQDTTDMHLLQGLAEISGARKSAMSMIVIQHYGMEHYAQRLLAVHRSEWEKTRGRFKESWLENTEQDVADIVASLFRSKDKANKNAQKVINRCVKTAKIFQSVGDNFATTALRCWPLHPVTIAALAKLSAYLGQNDRTVVGWVTSDSDSGFKYAAKQSSEWVFPVALYRHFFGNPQNLPVNPVWARRVSEICAADERFNGDNNALMLMQTIAVLNCIGGGVANEEMLKICLPQGFPFKKALSYLLQQSFIIYRRHRGEYCIWQGSDYDFVGAIADASEKITNFSLAAELNRSDILPEIIAHRHLIETGNIRILPVEFIDKGSEPSSPQNPDTPRALVYLTDKPQQGRSFRSSQKHDICGYLQTSKLMALGREAAALRMLLSADHRLQEDAAAKNEMERQMQFVNQKIADAVFDAVCVNMQWWFNGEKEDSVQSAASSAMNKAYSKGFTLHNELINRNRSGGTITGALRALCTAMVDSADKEKFGIEKHPPHLLIYKNFLRAKGLHVQNGKVFRLVFDENEVVKDLRPVVHAIKKKLFSENAEPYNIQDIIDFLAKPPYGVKQAPALILCVVCMVYYKDKLALYEKKEYAHNWGKTTLERLIGAPSLFALSPVMPSYADDALLVEYHCAVGGKKNGAVTVLSVARTLLIGYSKLDSYGRRSDSVSEYAQKFRRAIINAKSPADLLFKNLPAALDCNDFVKDQKIRQKYFRRVKEVLHELSGATTGLLDRLGNIVLQHYECANLHKAREQATKDASLVLQGRMYPVHKSFLRALQDKGDNVADDTAWLKHVAMSGLDAGKLPEFWTDSDEASAEFALRQNLIWLQNATELLKKQNGKNTFYAVGIEYQGNGAIMPKVDDAIDKFKEQFPPEERQKAMFTINYRLYKEES